MTTISTLPDAPSRTDPSTFSDKSDALLGALDQFVTETNTVAAEVVANRDLASGYATNADGSATDAAGSASAASASAIAAAGSASAASGSATTAAGSVVSAQAILDAVEAALVDGPVLSVNGMNGVVVIPPAPPGASIYTALNFGGF